MKQTHTLFSTQVFQAAINGAASSTKNQTFNRSLLHEISVLQRDDELGIAWSKQNYRHGYTSYGSVSRMFDYSPTFLELQRKIDLQLNKYLKALHAQVTTKDLVMNSMWVNVMPPGSYHTMHTHPFSVVSGTYYVELSKDSSPLKLEDPRVGLLMNAPLIRSDAPQTQQRYFYIQPRAGEVVFFESWLRHEVPENSSKKSRVSISFNYDWAPNANR